MSIVAFETHASGIRFNLTFFVGKFGNFFFNYFFALQFGFVTSYWWQCLTVLSCIVFLFSKLYSSSKKKIYLFDLMWEFCGIVSRFTPFVLSVCNFCMHFHIYMIPKLCLFWKGFLILFLKEIKHSLHGRLLSGELEFDFWELWRVVALSSSGEAQLAWSAAGLCLCLLLPPAFCLLSSVSCHPRSGSHMFWRCANCKHCKNFWVFQGSPFFYMCYYYIII